MPKTRPKHLDLLRIRLPVPAFVSILHRVSGAILFLLLPVVLWLWQASLENAETFGAFKALMARPLVKLAAIALVWAYFHHLCAGVRHLALDLHYGVSLEAGRATSRAVLAAGVVLALGFAVLIW